MKDDKRKERVKWFENDRFGMFIHWGLYAIPARGEWVRNAERMTKEEYQVYFDEFNPSSYEPREWARLAVKAGMKYAVMTAKHHDGFCLFDSEFTDYKSTNTQCKRDLVREYIDAFRAEGLKVGLYYSLLDWHHEHYPHYGDLHHPMRDCAEYSNENRDFNRYLEYMHAQVRELCTNYGTIDLLWFDFSYADMKCEKWRSAEMVDMVRSLQPNIIINSRLEVGGEGVSSLLTGSPSSYSGDFVNPEQIIPPCGIVDSTGDAVTWEACFTMNNNWGYSVLDNSFKSAELLIKKLVECVSKGGNMLLNVGPDAHGRIPRESVKVLCEIGEWMKVNKNSIYGCGLSGYEKPDLGRITRNGRKVYLHVYESTVGPLPITFIRASDIEAIRLLSTGAQLSISNSWTTCNFSDTVFINVAKDNCELPDPIDTVIEITLISENNNL